MRQRRILRAPREHTDPSHSGGFAGTGLRNGILAACDRFEANEEIKRQHGPVKILVKDGKLVDQDAISEADTAQTSVARRGQ